MASLRRIPRSPYWIAAFRRHDGKPTTRSTKLEAIPKHRRQAQRIAEAWEEAYRNGQAQQQLTKVFRQISRDLGGGELPTNRELAERWLENIHRTRTQSTYEAYRTAQRRWLGWLTEQRLANQSPDVLTRSHVARFRDWIAQQWGEAAANKALDRVKTILEEARIDGLVDINVALRVDSLRESCDFQRQPFSIEDLQTLWRHCNRPWRTLLMLGLFTGQRLGDLAKLPWSSVDLDKGEIRIVTTKTKRKQKIILATPLRDWLGDLDKGVYVIPEFAEMRTDSLSKAFGKLLTKYLAVDTVMVSGRNFKVKSFHSLRHTLPSMLTNAGVASDVIQAIVGHDSAAMTWDYTHVSPDRIGQAMDKITSPFS